MSFIRLEKILAKIAWCTLCLFACTLSAQERTTVDLHKITVEEGNLNFWVKCTENARLKEGVNKAMSTVTVNYKGLNRPLWLEVKQLQDTIIYAEDQKTTEKSTLSFLLDISNEMNDTVLRSAKKMIETIIDERSSDGSTDFFLTAYHQTTALKRAPISVSSASSVLSPISLEDKGPDFYRILMDELRYLEGLDGKKALFIFSSGANKAEGPVYQRQLPYEPKDIEKMVGSLPFNFNIFVVELVHDNDPLILSSLKSEVTQFSRGKLPDDYSKVLGDKREVLSNYIIQTIPNDFTREFKGEERAYTVSIDGATDSKDFRLGSVNFPINLQQQATWSDWFLWFAVGAIIILMILGVCSILIPFLRENEFKKNYVRPYVQEENRVRYDIYYNEPIQVGEMVVNKCRQVTPFTSWKENGWQCPNFSECLDQNCDGAGAPMQNSFFSKEGVFLKLNWIWFGAIGGFIAWMVINIFRIAGATQLNTAIKELVGDNFLKSISQDNPELVTQTIGNNLLVGIAFGAGLLLMLSWMEERRASNRYSVARSIMRIGLRTIAGILFAMGAFFIGFYLQYLLGIDAYLSGFVSWLLFGLGIGVIMSFYSSISTMNGIIGGIISAVIAFHIYWVLSEFLNTSFMQANLLSMILLGALIGSILVTVVTSMEDYELEVIAPIGYQRTIPISKWLNSNVVVMIGKAPGSYVYVKWEDEAVKPEHAELFKEDGRVFVQPVDEVLVNGRMISKPVALKKNDIIRLGRVGHTQFRFIEK